MQILVVLLFMALQEHLSFKNSLVYFDSPVSTLCLPLFLSNPYSLEELKKNYAYSKLLDVHVVVEMAASNKGMGFIKAWAAAPRHNSHLNTFNYILNWYFLILWLIPLRFDNIEL